ncbi:MAG: hypothetical protein JO016_13590 [Actinobacteria bacterium]|nr:hypothetical protein [Actinomycetota bacterium]
MKDLAALTPPAVVCVAFIIGVVMFLRREMAPKRRVREDARREANISGNNGIIDANEATSAARPEGNRDGNSEGNTVGPAGENPVANADEPDHVSRSSGDHGSPH